MKIKCSNCNLDFEIDDEDLSKILVHTKNWSAQFKFNKFGDVKLKSIHGRSSLLKKSIIPISWAIMGQPPEGFIWDHINRSPLNNKKSNFRLANIKQNNYNKNKIEGSSSFKNVTRHQCKWTVRVAKNGKNYYGGSFDSEIEAAKKANELMLQLHGEFANLNKIPEN